MSAVDILEEGLRATGLRVVGKPSRKKKLEGKSVIEVLREQKAAFDAAAERNKRTAADKKDCETDINVTLVEASAGEDDLATWSAYLIEAKRKLEVARVEHKGNIERTREELKAAIENHDEDLGAYTIKRAWQNHVEAIDGFKEFIGNLRQDVKEAKKAIAKIVEGKDDN